jgi:hypothetical protein
VEHLFWVGENEIAVEISVDRPTLCGLWEAPEPLESEVVLENGLRDIRRQDCPACVRILALTHALQLPQGCRS